MTKNAKQIEDIINLAEAVLASRDESETKTFDVSNISEFEDNLDLVLAKGGIYKRYFKRLG